MAKKIATSVDMLGNKITGLASATNPSDAVRFDQLSTPALSGGEVIDTVIKVKAVSTSNFTLSAPQTVDGVALVAGDFCLVRGQTSALQNGVYKVNTGAWTRATSYDTDAEIRSRVIVLSQSGTIGRIGDSFFCANSEPITIGTTGITIAQLPKMFNTTVPILAHTTSLAVSGESSDPGRNSVLFNYDNANNIGWIQSGRPGVISTPLHILASQSRFYGSLIVDGACTFYANTSTYGSLAVNALKSGYHGIKMAGLVPVTLMADEANGYGGVYFETLGKWMHAWDPARSLFFTKGALALDDCRELSVPFMVGGNTRMFAQGDNLLRIASPSNYAGIEFYTIDNGGYAQILSYDRANSIYRVLYIESASLSPARNGATTMGSTSMRWGQIFTNTSVDTGSDRRIKHDIEDVPVGLDFVCDLRPVQYKLNQNGTEEVPIGPEEAADDRGIPTKSVPTVGQRYHYGLIAQELKETMDKHGVDGGVWCTADKADPEALQSIRYEELISPMIKAIKELTERVKFLEGKIDKNQA